MLIKKNSKKNYNNKKFQEKKKNYFKGLSPTLNLELKLYLYADLLGSSFFFDGVKVQVIKSMVLKLILAIYSAGDYVIHKNERAMEAFFIVKGKCEVIIELGSKPVCQFHEGFLLLEVFNKVFIVAFSNYLYSLAISRKHVTLRYATL